MNSEQKPIGNSASDANGSRRSAFQIVLAIMAGVLVWGTIHAIGVYVSASEPNILKPIIVYTCVLAFLGFWALLLWNKQRYS